MSNPDQNVRQVLHVDADDPTPEPVTDTDESYVEPATDVEPMIPDADDTPEPSTDDTPDESTGDGPVFP